MHKTYIQNPAAHSWNNTHYVAIYVIWYVQIHKLVCNHKLTDLSEDFSNTDKSVSVCSTVQHW